MMFPVALLLIAAAPMLLEARLAARHDRALRVAGASDPPGDVYRVMQFAYPACFLAMALEAWWRGSQFNTVMAWGAVLFTAAKVLKYWAIATLGTRWTFRVLVPPHSTRVTSGPYRYIAHPNYVAVAAELAGMGLMAQAPFAAAVSIAGFGSLMLARIRIEERALGRGE
jgi:methyltransferase